ncbi:hypothetical protein AHiyo8_pI69000 (plasmid) [Arthrobacter sp. Hiyo8]|nr:hypothetical protein AHiyo8_pI69000 [Arthrobacter sp. Hiyo8]
MTVRTEGTPGVTVTTSPGTSKLATLLHLPGLAVRPDASGRVVVRSSAIDAEIDRQTRTLPQPAIRKLFEQLGEGLTDVDPTTVRAERIQIAHRPYPSTDSPSSASGTAAPACTSLSCPPASLWAP